MALKGIGRAVTGSPPFWALLACGLCAAWPLAGAAAALFGLVVWLGAWAARLWRRVLAERREARAVPVAEGGPFTADEGAFLDGKLPVRTLERWPSDLPRGER